MGSFIHRRNLLVALGGTAVGWPTSALAQRPATPVIGYLSSKGESTEADTIAAIRRGLNERGFVEGSGFNFIYRWSEGDYNRLPGLAVDLVDKGVNAIVASGYPAALAAKTATSTIPIVFRLGIDPVSLGLVQSFDRPEGNITGVTMLFDPLLPKKFQLLHELVPTAKIGLLVNPSNQNAGTHRDQAEHAAAALDLRLSVLMASRAEDMEWTFANARENGIGALVIGDDPLFDVIKYQLISAAAQYRIATMYYVRDFAAAGGLISYGPSFDEMARLVGLYLGRILEGAKPAELPVQQPTKIDLVINVKTAKALGLEVPTAFLLRADEVIE